MCMCVGGEGVYICVCVWRVCVCVHACVYACVLVHVLLCLAANCSEITD